MYSYLTMKTTRRWLAAVVAAAVLTGCVQQKNAPQGYAEMILENELMNRVDSMARAVVSTGFNAGEPMGSGTFRGEAGVLYKANALLREWAKGNR